jgi:hypothetical protein
MNCPTNYAAAGGLSNASTRRSGRREADWRPCPSDRRIREYVRASRNSALASSWSLQWATDVWSYLPAVHPGLPFPRTRSPFCFTSARMDLWGCSFTGSGSPFESRTRCLMPNNSRDSISVPLVKGEGDDAPALFLGIACGRVPLVYGFCRYPRHRVRQLSSSVDGDGVWQNRQRWLDVGRAKASAVN